MEKTHWNVKTYNEEKKEWEGTATYMAGETKEAKKGVDVSTFQGKVDWKKVKKAGSDGIKTAVIYILLQLF